MTRASSGASCSRRAPTVRPGRLDESFAYLTAVLDAFGRPVVRWAPPQLQLPHQRRHILSRQHPTQRRQLEPTAENTIHGLGHQSSSRELSPLSVSHFRGALDQGIERVASPFSPFVKGRERMSLRCCFTGDGSDELAPIVLQRRSECRACLYMGLFSEFSRECPLVPLAASGIMGSEPSISTAATASWDERREKSSGRR